MTYDYYPVAPGAMFYDFVSEKDALELEAVGGVLAAVAGSGLEAGVAGSVVEATVASETAALTTVEIAGTAAVEVAAIDAPAIYGSIGMATTNAALGRAA